MVEAICKKHFSVSELLDLLSLADIPDRAFCILLNFLLATYVSPACQLPLTHVVEFHLDPRIYPMLERISVIINTVSIQF
jgi:hypothetical protein